MSDEVTVLIQNKRFVFWESVRITRSIDAVDAIEMSAPFDHEAPDFKENFKPFSFNPIVVSVDNVPLFTGTMLDVNPEVTPTSSIVTAAAYAKCGVLQDCTAPADAMPLEYNNLNLKEIAEKLASYFKINVEFRDDPGPAFTRVACDPEKRVFEFLTELSKQRGLIISSNTSGDLLFWRSVSGTPVAKLDHGLSPLQTVTPAFRTQDYYTELTGLAPIEVQKAAAKKTLKTKKDAPKVKQPKPAKKYSKFSVEDDAEVFRPLMFKIDDIDGADIETATNAKRARMLGNMVAYTIEVTTWRDSFGKLWAPNTTLSLRSPDAMIYDFYDFEITQVVFEQTGDAQTATITLALPGSFSGEPPEVFPWEL